MARNRNKKLRKVQMYRDKLMARVTTLEGYVRHGQAVLGEIRKALAKEDHLRAYALATDEEGAQWVLTHVDKNDVINELALVYRMLNVERTYTSNITTAVRARDLLRLAALAANHTAESRAHDQMLDQWSKDHGFIRSLRKELENEDAA